MLWIFTNLDLVGHLVMAFAKHLHARLRGLVLGGFIKCRLVGNRTSMHDLLDLVSGHTGDVECFIEHRFFN